MLGRIEELSNLIGVSGDEGRVRRYIKAELEKIQSLEMKTDTMGNLIVHRKGEGVRVMVSAHMDEIGMIVMGALDNGLLAYGQYGIDPRVVVSKRVLVGDDMIEGVIGAKAIHLQTMADRRSVLGHRELFVDIGAKDKDDALGYVKPGDRIGFATKFKRLGEKRILGKALDNRIGCAILMRLIENEYDCDFYGVFTVQEEIDRRGMAAAAYTVAPDVALILECTHAADMPENTDKGFVTRMGHGAAISFMDSGTIVAPAMYKALTDAAEAASVSWQPRQGINGSDDQASVQRIRTGCKTGCIAVPCRYVHTPASVADLDDINAAYALADAFLSHKKFNEVL